jgi:aryl-alcohol dehydrogenase-like predicted oxidoreductase
MTNHTMGLGCWAIGGPFFSGDRAVGWGEVDDATSVRAVHAAVDLGIRLFDTAQAYGAGHSETVLGQALSDRPDVRIVTKIGLEIDPATRRITGEVTNPAAIRTSIDGSCARLKRDHIDTVLLHLNELSISTAGPIFDMLADLRTAGQIGGYGWSTDFPDRAAAFAKQPGFTTVEHAMNVFFRAEQLVPVIEDTNLIALIRSPLAMGILGGRYDSSTTFRGEIRAGQDDWNDYFTGGKVSESYLIRLNAVREILSSDGRSLAQGAIAWLWARTSQAVPIPGFRTPEQVIDLCGALAKGPLTPEQMDAVEAMLQRPPEGPPRAR